MWMMIFLISLGTKAGFLMRKEMLWTTIVYRSLYLTVLLNVLTCQLSTPSLSEHNIVPTHILMPDDDGLSFNALSLVLGEAISVAKLNQWFQFAEQLILVKLSRCKTGVQGTTILPYSRSQENIQAFTNEVDAHDEVEVSDSHVTLEVEGDLDAPKVCSDECKFRIIREFQEHVDVKNWVSHACAVCGQKKYPFEFGLYDASTLNLDVLQNPDIPKHLWPHAFLSPHTRHQPVNTIANYQYYAYDWLPEDIKLALGSLTTHELQLVAACRFSQISYVYSVGKGGVRDELQYSICVVFVGGKYPTKDNLKELYPVLVSKNKVEKVIKFFLAENMFYRGDGIEYSQNNLDVLCNMVLYLVIPSLLQLLRYSTFHIMIHR
ncbi:hypothetical protein OF83DRAFT_1086661 [Amylostereum chailletii]|nr:hypothetical protein OF83DRAFT_1086661 [Amylostereum chailletii]